MVGVKIKGPDGTEVETSTEEMQAAAEHMKGGNTAIEGVAGQKIATYIKRVQRLEEEKQNIADTIKDVYAEAKAAGLEPDIIKEMVKCAKTDIEKIRGKRETFDLYCASVGGEFSQYAFSF